ncbi:hypothetical protein CO112_02295 [Candidatus Dojkabacteria bacterium CG_4_9_14_3_um_filter_150_Dojkabacteria_WS6_41_13]|uniref:Uncharacterized protein n=1 Tax=Candidatus Dojkabacteria bacterium CG_4_10_14_0_2_um_filter_Dojkabacteria_WS6_41_15 TaxID=2014249 RepID=A0A2M7W2C5_9BACT|nr:MAG: hypothetical protein COZ14_03325 [Candidatus Dojkabacteria bacterium CG_4_10_14_3_um_filter_Dojkabacteria_WS6_41_9]PJA14519.1 MAG: hypothetical protein COX64_01900 [Candidatus Dojkabacteria bacterium CG_4_10_14_0_2_um_filter_Dojkabacteria_WS6_41_15]PJB22829.1 MAG: hypothetical protein CO112_02295 [Candidatus Dojkabacteria bacterium CG_4_9_14_3_um_filter_150_Dojkabacteria_WS6_41_13]
MNQAGAGVPVQEREQPNQGQPMSEIPSYPGANQEQQYAPGQESASAPVIPYELPAVAAKPQSELAPIPANMDSYNPPEHVTIPQSKSPELQTNIAFETTRAGERVFVNPELGQPTYRGGVTSQQLVSKVSGYYVVQQGLISDPKSGLLQQTATSGDPTSASTWQATVLYKILQAFWNILGIS